jgi:exosortase
LFMVPLPGVLTDTLTGPLKQYVSVVVDEALFLAGYPIARSGVVLAIGPYELLVADACSGLGSIFSLSAMGLLYLYLLRHTRPARNLILAAAIVPFAFAANVVRVIALVLITYYWGDAAAQGFLHGFAGVALFVTAILMLVALDALLGKFFRDHRAPVAAGSAA